MYIARRTFYLMQSALKSFGPSAIKRFLWNKEYSGDKWNFADNTLGDCVYKHLEKHAAGGAILDLGCGAGNTATELDASAYRMYLGVDISEACLKKAERRSKECGRADKNHFACGDFLSYEPAHAFDLILFRESMYHVPMGKIASTIDHYSKYLRTNGVFVVRMGTHRSDGTPSPRPIAMMNIIKAKFDVVEDCHHEESGAEVIVFRPTAGKHKKTPASVR